MRVLKMQLRYPLDLVRISNRRIFTAGVICAQSPLQSVALTGITR